MKVAYASDLHLEFWDMDLKNTVGADVLILAGDVMVAEAVKRFPFYDNDRGTDSHYEHDSQRYQKFFEAVANEFERLIYVAGNHEHYRGYYNKTANIIKSALSAIDPSRLTFLDKDHVYVGDVKFVGGTLWADFERATPTVMHEAGNSMNDRRVITYDRNGCYRAFRPSDALFEHAHYRDYIKHATVGDDSEKIVVVTHHAPSYKSIAPVYAGHSLNGAYASDLSEIILNRNNIKYWVHGHIHNKTDYMVGQCRVLANPRGYPNELGEFVLETFDV